MVCWSEELEINHNLFSSGKGSVVTMDGCSVCCAETIALYQSRTPTPLLYRARKSFVAFWVWLVFGRCEITALLNELIVPLISYAGWCSRMRLDKYLVMRSISYHRNTWLNRQHEVTGTIFLHYRHNWEDVNKIRRFTTCCWKRLSFFFMRSPGVTYINDK